MKLTRRKIFGWLGAAAASPVLAKAPLGSSKAVPYEPATPFGDFTHDYGSFGGDVGSAEPPAISFCADTDTGMYRSSANEIRICVGGKDVGKSD